ncbi:MAG: DUF11 domain-containing protein, partial [Anaerolineales bacterium]|nr:DUF11 domain-containing protein [Anaerolineales bacterium]
EKLEPGETASIQLRANIDGGIIGQGGHTFTNTLAAPLSGDVYPADNEDMVVAHTGPDVFVEKWLSDGTPAPDGIVTFTIRFGNRATGPWGGDPSFASHITDTLPTGTSFVSARAPWADPWLPSFQAGDVVAWGWDPMWADNAWEFEVAVRISDTVTASQVLTNVVAAYGDSPDDIEPFWDNNVVRAAMTVYAPSFEVSKVYTGNRVAGTPVTYTLTVTNSGNLTATGVVLTDWLPDWVTYGGGGDSYSAGLITWTLPSLAPNSTAEKWFSGALTCQVGELVTNTHYRVSASDQGVTSDDGLPVGFAVIAPRINVDMQTAAPTAGLKPVYFTATVQTNGTPVSGTWSFGDGASASGLTASHTYSEPAVYTVVFTATDACGYQATESATIIMTERSVLLPLMLRN